jgi:hypothetical protein
MPIDVRAAKKRIPTNHIPSPCLRPPLVTPLSSVSDALPLTCFLTLSMKYWLLSPTILPAGKYSQTTYHPGVSADCQSMVHTTILKEAALTVLSLTRSSSTTDSRRITPNQLREMSCSFTKARFIPIVLLSLEAPSVHAGTGVGISSCKILARSSALQTSQHVYSQ